MRRHWKKFLLLPVALLLALALVLGWLAHGAAGSRLLAAQLQASLGDSLGWAQMEGPLAGPLVITGLYYRDAGTEVTVDRLAFDWRPSALLRGQVVVTTLQLDGVQATLPPATEPAPAEEPFTLPSLDTPLPVTLQALHITGLVLQLPEQSPVRIDDIALAGSLADGVLALDTLTVRAPKGALDGSGLFATRKGLPLRLDLGWQGLLPDGREAGGTLRGEGSSEQLRIDYEGSGALPVRLAGELRQLFAEPGWQLALQWPEWQPVTGEAPLSLAAGSLRSEGDLNGYRVASEGAVLGALPEALAWQLQGQGDSGALQLESLILNHAGQQLTLAGAVDWRQTLQAALTYHGEVIPGDPALPPQLDLRGSLRGAWQEDRIQLQRFDLAVDQSPMVLEASGLVQLPAAGEPLLDLTLNWRDVGWPLAAAEADFASPEGEVAVSGTPTAFALALAFTSGGSQLPPGQWRGQVNGSDTGVLIEHLRGELLAGTVTLSGPLSWSPELAGELVLTGKDLQPAQWDAALPADLALDARLLLEGESLTLNPLRLASGGNELAATASLQGEQLDAQWTLAAPSPGTLLAGAAGELAGTGAVTGPLHQLQASAQLKGSRLAVDGLSLAALQLQLTAGTAPAAPLQLVLRGEQLADSGELLAGSFGVEGGGTTANHRIDITVAGASEQLAARLQGGLSDDLAQWQGQLARLALSSETAGSWRQQQDTALALGADRATLARTCLEAADGAGVACLAADWRAGGSSAVSGDLSALPVARLLPDISGTLAGTFAGQLDARGQVTGEARFALTPGEIRVRRDQQPVTLAHGGGALALALGSDGLQANLDFAAPEGGTVAATVAMPQLRQLPQTADEPLAGQVRAQLPDLSSLPAWVPALATASGRLDADLTLAGTLGAPQLLGELALRDGAATVPDAGLALRDIRFSARGEAADPGVLQLAGGMASGRGRIDFDGRAALSGERAELALTGERFRAFDTPDGRVTISPDLTVDWREEVLTLRGRVLVPEASITPQLALLSGGEAQDPAAVPAPGQPVLPSPDVVVLGADEPPPPEWDLPFRLDSQLELVLGDKVNVNALGFVSDIAGAVTFTHSPDNPNALPLARGRFTLDNGTFKAFGQDLEITSGQVIFPGGPVTEPELAVTAVRWINNDPNGVTAAGVRVRGEATEPLLELFSRPQLEDQALIQSYLLTGRGSGGGDTVLTVGTYLNPRLYVGYGYNLIESTSEFNSLFSITPRYGVGASVGEADSNVSVTFTYEH